MTFRSKARRAGWLLVVAAFAFGLFTAIVPSKAHAYGLISARSIKMSSSIFDANNVLYHVQFTIASDPISVGSVIIHFCSNDPIIGDTCIVPTGFNTNYATTTLTGFTGGGGFTAPTIDTVNSTQNALILKENAVNNVTGKPSIAFDLGNGTTNGIHNPSATNTTFYARITIYNTLTPAWAAPSGSPLQDSATTAPTTDSTTEKTALDAGGTALSTANALAVTAKVQEQLTFCVYTDPTSCSGGGNTIALGDSNGVLAATNTYYTNPAATTPKIDIASNALGGVMVRLKGDTLTSGAFTITAQGEGAATGYACVADSTATNTEQFGLRVVSYGTGQQAAAVSTLNNEDDFGCLAGNHKFVPTNTNTTYGEPFIVTTGATDLSTSTLELGAKAASTTEAGVYKTTLQFIATATY